MLEMLLYYVVPSSFIGWWLCTFCGVGLRFPSYLEVVVEKNRKKTSILTYLLNSAYVIDVPERTSSEVEKKEGFGHELVLR